MDFNVQFNEEPLIFATPTSPNGSKEFKLIFYNINPWTTTNKANANPLHIGAEAFDLSKIIPDYFKIPAEYLQATDGYGNGYLHYALQGKYWKENSDWLIKHGVDPTIPNNFGDIPQDIINQRVNSLDMEPGVKLF